MVDREWRFSGCLARQESAGHAPCDPIIRQGQTLARADGRREFRARAGIASGHPRGPIRALRGHGDILPSGRFLPVEQALHKTEVREDQIPAPLLAVERSRVVGRDNRTVS